MSFGIVIADVHRGADVRVKRGNTNGHLGPVPPQWSFGPQASISTGCGIAVDLRVISKYRFEMQGHPHQQNRGLVLCSMFKELLRVLLGTPVTTHRSGFMVASGTSRMGYLPGGL